MAQHPAVARIASVSLVVGLALVGCEDPDHRADIVVYGDHVPAFTNRGDPFPNPFSTS